MDCAFRIGLVFLVDGDKVGYMKTSILPQQFKALIQSFLWRGFVPLSCVAIMILTGCKTTGYDKGNDAARRLQKTASGLTAERIRLEVTIAAMNDLFTNGTGDLRVQFDRFNHELEKLDATSRGMKDNAAKLREHGAAYFEIWNQELQKVNDAQIRQASTQRRTEAMGMFNNAVTHYENTRPSLVPLIAYLSDIRNALSTDLTAAGLQSVRGSAQTATDRSAKVKDDLGQTASDLQSVSEKMSYIVAPPPGNDSTAATTSDATNNTNVTTNTNSGAK
jgi:hypothetical protein